MRSATKFLLVAAFFVCIAFVQSQPVQAVEPRTVPPGTLQIQPQATQPTMAMTPEMEIDALKKKVTKLQDQNKQLTDQNSKLTDQNNKLNQQIGEMTKKGGSLVKAFCEGQSMSKNTAGASRNCATTGYNCEPVSGLCYTQCGTSDQCIGGFVCDTAEKRCVNVRGY